MRAASAFQASHLETTPPLKRARGASPRDSPATVSPALAAAHIHALNDDDTEEAEEAEDDVEILERSMRASVDAAKKVQKTKAKAKAKATAKKPTTTKRKSTKRKTGGTKEIKKLTKATKTIGNDKLDISGAATGGKLDETPARKKPAAAPPAKKSTPIATPAAIASGYHRMLAAL